MRRASAIFILLVTGVSWFATANEVRCKADPKECERQIRSFLAEKKYLGVTLQMTRWGVVVRSVAPDSPAERAGLMEQDRIIGINGADVTSSSLAEIKKRLLPPGKDVNLTLMVNRLGDLARLQVKLSVMPDEQIEKIILAHLARSHQEAVDNQN